MNVVTELSRDRSRWIEVGRLSDIPRQGARIVRTPGGDVAIFRTADDRLYAIDNRCPHRHGPLSQGIVAGGTVTCPLHNWAIDLATGEAQGADQGCVRTHGLKIAEERVFLALAPRAAAAE